MIPLLPLLATTLLHVAPGEALHVQASALNLRSEPKASATLRDQVPIGSTCTVISLRQEGWAELSCPRGTGFGKLELLGPDYPNHAQLLAQGKEPGRPLPDALNLLQRAVTLRPDDPPTQMAFRELFWKAEFDRLVRTRATNKILKKESRFSKGCDDLISCAVAAFEPKPGSTVVWLDLYFRGTDFAFGQIFADGLFHLRSGFIDLRKRTLTVQLESFMVPSEAVLRGLGVTGVKDACAPQPPAENEAVCGDDYEQSCAPDDCWDPYASCKQAPVTRCQECKFTCKNSCTDCRMKCGTDNRQECVASCMEATRQCEATCQKPVKAEHASCQARYEACSQEAVREWNRTCEAPCGHVFSCVDRCQQENPAADRSTCLEQCDNQLPETCRESCLFNF
jgi:hypothetical protein